MGSTNKEKIHWERLSAFACTIWWIISSPLCLISGTTELEFLTAAAFIFGFKLYASLKYKQIFLYYTPD